MAKKIMQCKEAPEIELQFDGGEAILLRFDIRCLMNIQETEEGLKSFFESGIAEQTAKIIYAAGKDINEGLDEERARAIVAGMSIENITDIIETFGDSVGTSGKDDEKVKKMMAQLLGAKQQQR